MFTFVSTGVLYTFYCILLCIVKCITDFPCESAHTHTVSILHNVFCLMHTLALSVYRLLYTAHSVLRNVDGVLSTAKLL